MNFLRLTLASTVLATAMAFTACGDKTTPVIIEQSERINTELQSLVQENPKVLAEASAKFAEDKIAIDVKLADSLFMVPYISEPLFNYFTAYEVKAHINKDLEITYNALAEKDYPIVVSLTDVYGDSRSYEITPTLLRRMIKSPLTQLDYNEAREGLFAAMAASEAQFMPASGAKSVSTSFKGGFFSYNVEFEKASSYKDLTTANLKSRALKVLEPRYANPGSFRPVLFGVYKSFGIDGFHLVYSAGENSKTLKTTVTLSHLHN